MDDIEAATLDEVRDFFRRYYTPSNAVLTLAGDFDESHALDRIEHWFGELPAGPPVEQPKVGPIVLDAERRDVLPDDVSLGRVYASWPGPAYGEADWYTADLLSVVLAGGKSALLHDDLVYEHRLASSVGVHVLRPSCRRPCRSSPPPARTSISTRSNDASTTGSSAWPRSRCRRTWSSALATRLLTHHYDDLQQLPDRADALSQHTTFFDAPEGVAREIERYHEPTAADLQRFVRERLRPDRRAILHVVPREATPTGSRVVSRPDRTRPPAPTTRKPCPFPHFVDQTLDNGLRLLAVPVRAFPIITAEILMPSGNQHNPLGRPGLARLHGSLLTEGTDRHTGPQLATAIETLGGSLTSGAGWNLGWTELNVLAANADAGLDLLAETTLGSCFPDDQVERVRDAQLANLLRRRSSPAMAAEDTFNRVVYDGTPYAAPLDGRPDAVETFDRETVIDFHRRHVVPEGSCLIAVGDLEPESLRDRARGAVGSLEP